MELMDAGLNSPHAKPITILKQRTGDCQSSRRVSGAADTAFLIYVVSTMLFSIFAFSPLTSHPQTKSRSPGTTFRRNRRSELSPQLDTAQERITASINRLSKTLNTLAGFWKMVGPHLPAPNTLGAGHCSRY